MRVQWVENVAVAIYKLLLKSCNDFGCCTNVVPKCYSARRTIHYRSNCIIVYIMSFE